MTRENAKLKLVDMGIAEPTEEQITKYLDSITAETKTYKDKLANAGDKDATIAELEKKLEQINKQNMSDIELANAEKEEALKSVKALKEQIQTMVNQNELAKIGIVGEDAENLMKNGAIDFATLGQIISAREKASATAREKELAGQATNPGGGSASSGAETQKTEAEQIAENLGKTASATSKDSEAIIASYKS